MAIVFMGAAIFGENVLTSVQILWVNLIMDCFAALALATEAPNASMLDRMPHKRNTKIINSVMWRNVFS
jgi:magnesium-transporting ATPase (P-type)